MLYVDACYSLLNHVKENLDGHHDLPNLVRELTGEKPRRMDRFTLLALAGALQCGDKKNLSANAGIVLATAVGTLSTAVDMMKKIGVEKQPPKPFQFVNSLGNSACYSLARHLKISGPSIAVSHEHASFESGLAHAELMMSDTSVPQIMLGGLDEVPLPVADNLRRHNVDGSDYSTCSDGAHWLRVSALPAPQTFASIRVLGQYPVEGDPLETVRDRLQQIGILGEALPPVFWNVPLSEGCSGEQPLSDVLPHGVYSGHSFVRACEYIRSTKEQGKGDIPICTVVATVSRDRHQVYISLVEAV